MMLAADWQNPGQAFDVNDDLSVSPLDVLVGVNRLEQNGSGPLSDPGPDGPEQYYDVNGDGSHSPLDALLVINVLEQNLQIVTARLLNDTARDGQSNRDLVTANANIEGSISPTGATASVQVQVDGDAPQSVAVDAAGAFTFAPGLPLDGTSDGEHTISVRRIATSDRPNEFVSLTFTLDTTPPASPSLNLEPLFDSPPVGDRTTTLAQVELVGQTSPAVIARLAEPNLLAVADDAGQFRFADVALAGGVNSFTVQAIDRAGNVSQTTQAITRGTAIDTTPPTLTLDSPGQTLRSNGNLTITGQVTDEGAAPETLLAQVDLNDVSEVALDASGRFTFTTSLPSDGTADGRHVVRFRATDNVGNVSALTTVDWQLDTTQPVITSNVFAIERTAITTVALTFSEPLADTAFDAGNYVLSRTNGPDAPVDIAITELKRIDSQNVTLTLAEPLQNFDYELTALPAIKDLAGNLPTTSEIEFQVARPTRVSELSPTGGEEMVSLTRETIVRFDGQVDSATVTLDSFYLIANGERLAGHIRVSPTERFATFFYDTPLPASTEVRIVVEGDKIMGRDGLALDADRDGEPGGTKQADFRTLPLTYIPGTQVFGFLYDSYNRNPDGSDIPIVGATISLDANPAVFAVTDENGFFELGLQDLDNNGQADGLPAPEFFVHIDGSTATGAPAGAAYATLGKPFHTVPGQREQLNMQGTPFNIYLPPMSKSDIVDLNANEDTVVGFGAAAQAQIRAMFPADSAKAQMIIDTMAVTYPSGSAMDQDGNMATLATIIPVDPDRLPAPLPPGQNPSLVISIQAGTAAGFNLAGGSTNFDVPAPVTFPNLDGLAPGERAFINSFDHDAGVWRVVGTATVAAGGTMLVSDPGSGIQAPGWHYIDPLARLAGGGMDSNGDQCHEQLDALEKAQFDLALSVLPFDGLIGSAITAYGRFNSAHGILTASSNEESAKLLFEAVAGDLVPPLGYIFGIRDIVDSLGDYVGCLIGSSLNNPNVVQRMQEDLTLQKQLYDGVAAFYEQLTGTPKVNQSSNPADYQRTRTLLNALPKILASGSDGGVAITAAECNQLKSLPRPSHWTAADIEALCDHVSALATADASDSLLSAVTNSLGTLVASLDAAVNAGWQSTGDGTDRLLRQFTQSESQRLSTVPVGQAYYSISGGLSSRGQLGSSGAFTKFAVAANTAITVDYAQVFRGVSSASGVSSVPAAVFQVGMATVTSGGPGSCVQIPQASGRDPDPTDTDMDGVPDEVELIIGTAINNGDTDGDGASDLAELLGGDDPLGNQSFPIGILARLELQGEANEVVVAQRLDGNGRQTAAYVATGSHGMAIIDVTQRDNPIILGQIDLLGDAVDVAVDPLSSIAAVASGDGGLHFIDITDPMMPVLLRTANIDATQVESLDGVIYAAVAGQIVSYDPVSGELLSSLLVPDAASFVGLTHAGNFLYSQDTNLKLHTLEVSGLRIISRGSIDLPQGGGHLSVDAGIVYAGAQSSYTLGGFVTVDVSDPDAPTVISGSDVVDPLIAPGLAVVPNGSGLGLAVGLVGRQANVPVVSLVSLADPEATDNYRTEFGLPSRPESVAIAAGIGFVADGIGGLVVLNYLPADNQSVPPMATISGPDGSDVQEGSLVAIRVNVTDDVQVRDVELLMNGRVVTNDISAPFELQAIAPARGTGLTMASFQVRATDTGGNSSLSNELVYNLTADQTPPMLIGSSPADRGVGFQTSAITLRFDEPLDTTGLSLGGFSLIDLGANARLGGGDDVNVRLKQVTALSSRRVVVYTDQPLTEGRFQFTVAPSVVSDVAGNKVEQPIAITFTSFDFDEQNAVAWISDSNGDWNNPGNWSGGEVPGPNDAVIIDRKVTNVKVRLSSGNVQVRSLLSREEFIMDGGSLTVSEPSEINARFEIGNGATLTVDGPTAQFVANGSTKIDGGSFIANAGGQIHLPSATRYTHSAGIVRDTTVFRATGANSLLDLRNLVSMTNGSDRFDTINIEASFGGTVDLRGVTQIVDPNSGEVADRSVNVLADGNSSAVNLSALTNFNDVRSGFATGEKISSSITARNGGTVNSPQLSTLDGVRLVLDGNGTIPISRIATFTDGNLELVGGPYAFSALTNASGTLFQASGRGTPATFPVLTNVDGASFDLSAGAALALPEVRNYTHTVGATVRDTILFRATGTDSVLDLRNLATITNGQTRNDSILINALSGGHINLSGVAQIVEIDAGDRANRRVEIQADGSGSRVDLSTLTSFNDVFSGSTTGENRYSLIRPINGGTIDSPQFRTADGVRLILDGTGNFAINQLTDWTDGALELSGDTYGFVSLTNASGTFVTSSGNATEVTLGQLVDLHDGGITLQSGGTVEIPNLRNIDGATLDVSGGVTLSIPMATTYTHTAGDLRNTVSIRATGTNSLLDLANLTSITNGQTRSDIILIDALSGGRINLSGVEQIAEIDAGDRANRRVEIQADGSGSRVDLSTLTNFNDVFTGSITGENRYSLIQVKNNGRIVTTSDLLLDGIRVATSSDGVFEVNRLRIGPLSELAGQNGSVIGNVVNNANVKPGTSPGRLTVTGDFVQSVQGKLTIELDGPGAGVGYDQLVVTGTATLDGTVELLRASGFIPAVGSQFLVLTYGSRVGEFATFSSLDAGGGNVFVPSYSGAGLTLTVAAPLLAPAVATVPNSDNALTDEQVQPLLEAAMLRWLSTNSIGDRARALNDVRVQVADLDGRLLGLASGNTIWIDRDAAGHGWFVDATPLDDAEFSSAGAALKSRPADDRMDLLSVVMHELGHLFGWEHAAEGDSLMSATLDPGFRSRISAENVDALLGEWDDA
ncbi:MAG: Ig-like domain-containing protein [Planctomycetota bacterium]|nr:Ig-like domain-containing protein [Planctomycetota bacterium]